MVENHESQRVLQSYARKAKDSSLVEDRDETKFVIERDGLRITITVPRSVQEWFVDVEELATGLRLRDWCDYAGYEPRTVVDQRRDMAEDLDGFLAKIISSPLRVRRLRPEQQVCVVEWRLDATWQQAVPMTGS